MGSSAFDKQSSSRPIGPVGYQVIQNAQGAFTKSNPFQVSTQQIRVLCQNQGWAAIAASTVSSAGSTVMPTSGGAGGMLVTGLSTFSTLASFVGNVYPEYFAVTPGQMFCFASTSTSSGAISITEMG